MDSKKLYRILSITYVLNVFYYFPLGMLTNYKQLKDELYESDPGLRFQSDTDTEVVAKLAKLIYDLNGGRDGITFREIVEQVCLKLVSQYTSYFI